MQKPLHKFRDKFQAFFSESIFVTSLVLIFTMLLALVFVRWQQLPNLAEILPADTEAFIIVDTTTYPAAADRVALPLTQLDWAGKHLGFAIVDNEPVTLIELRSKRKAKKFMSNLLIDNYFFLGDFLILATDKTADLIQAAEKTAKSNLESTGEYQNARGRLPYFSDAFVYVDLQSARHTLISFFGNFGIAEPGYLETILQIFPAFAASIDFNLDVWKAESFTAIDKSRIDGEGYFRHDKKYKQELPPLTSGNQAFEWGGHDLSAQLIRVAELLAKLNPSAALVFNSSLNEAVRGTFGEEVDFEQLYELLSDEYYFGWTPNDNFLLILELGDEEKIAQASLLKDDFVNNYQYAKTSTLSNGELRAEFKSPEGMMAKYADTQYFRFEVDSKFIMAIAILEDLAIMSTSEEEFFAVLDKIQAGQNQRNIAGSGLDAKGADEIFALHLDILPEANMLKELLSTFSEIQITRKIFDDGLYTRSSLLLNGNSN